MHLNTFSTIIPEIILTRKLKLTTLQEGICINICKHLTFMKCYLLELPFIKYNVGIILKCYF